MNYIRLTIALVISLSLGSLFLVSSAPHYYDFIFANTQTPSLTQLPPTSGLSLQSLPPFLIGILLGSTLSVALYNLLRFFYTRYYNNMLLAITLGCLLLFLFFITSPTQPVASNWLSPSENLVYGLVIVSLLFLHAICLKCSQQSHHPNSLSKPLLVHMALLCLSLVGVCLSSTFCAQNIVYYVLISSTVLLLSCTGSLWRSQDGTPLSLSLGVLILLIPLIAVWPCLLDECLLSADQATLLIFTSLVVAAFILSIALSQAHYHTASRASRALNMQATEEGERRARSELLAKISHEIRTPLSGVLGMTTLLLDTPLSSKQRDYAHTIQGSGNELLSLINEILDISRFESNEVVLSQTPFNLADLLQECSQAFSNRAQEQQIELTIFLQPQTPEVILGDPIRFRQVVLSMLTNAFQRTQHGEVVLSVTVQQSDTAQHLVLSVQDTGIPLSDQERHILSTAQLHSKDLLSASFIGGNLGIIIARQLISLMSGTFQIKRSPQGTVFTFSIPVQAQDNPVSQAQADTVLRQQHILIIDSNALSLKVLAQQCSEWGMLVSTRASIVEAIALLRNRGMQGQRFKAIIISETTHNPTAIAFAIRVKEDPLLTADSRLIMLTSSSQVNAIAARNAGINHILMKPVSGSTLKTTLINAIQQSVDNTESAHQLSGKRILVAEDDPISVKVISGLLSKLGISIDIATNGKIAVEMLQKNHYDLVLMDCEMPVLDGFTAAKQHRAYEAKYNLAPIPIIALSAHVLEEHHVRAKQSGMNGHLAKPIELAKLQAILRNNTSN